MNYNKIMEDLLIVSIIIFILTIIFKYKHTKFSVLEVQCKIFSYTHFNYLLKVRNLK